METILKDQLITKDDIKDRLSAIGVKKGMVLEVHSSLSSLGYVIGGAQTVVDALMELLTPGGTLIMPYQTMDNTEPSLWKDPAIELESVPFVRDNMPAYDPVASDDRNMGAVVENFRKREGVLKSNHPQYGFIAWGQYAKALCNYQSLHFGLSQESPTARLYELKGCTLLLGVDYDCATSMHLAEYKTECRPVIINGAKVNKDGNVIWEKFLDLKVDSKIFLKIGRNLEEKNKVAMTTIGKARVKLFRIDVAVDEATSYFEKFMPHDMYR